MQKVSFSALFKKQSWSYCKKVELPEPFTDYLSPNLYTKTLQNSEFSVRLEQSLFGGLLSLCDRRRLVGGTEEGTGGRVSCRPFSTDVGTDSGTEGTLDSGTPGRGKFALGDSALLRLDWGVTNESNWSVIGGFSSAQQVTVVTTVNSSTSLTAPTSKTHELGRWPNVLTRKPHTHSLAKAEGL